MQHFFTNQLQWGDCNEMLTADKRVTILCAERKVLPFQTTVKCVGGNPRALQ